MPGTKEMAAKFAIFSRMLAKTKVGPGRRMYGQSITCRLDADAWTSHLAQSGADGGISGLHIDFNEEKTKQWRHQPPPLHNDHCSLAAQDMGMIHKALKTMTLRKSSPPLSVPVELWKIILAPNKVSKPKTTGGIGSNSQDTKIMVTHERLKAVLRQVRWLDMAPLAWFRAWACAIDKRNGKAGPNALRILARKCLFGQAVEKGYKRYGYIGGYGDYAFGGVRGRRREGTIIIQNVVSWRLRTLGIPHATGLYDQANAFHSVDTTRLDKTDDEYLRAADAGLAKSSIHRTSLHINAFDSDVDVLMRSGVAQGRAAGPLRYIRTFDRDVLKPMAMLFIRSSPEARTLISACPFKGKHADLSMTAFMDDVAKIVIAYTVNALLVAVTLASNLLESFLRSIGGKQNVDKQVQLIRIPGKNSSRSESYTGPGRVAPSALYLGALLSADGSNKLERNARLKATKKAWAFLQGFWTSQGVVHSSPSARESSTLSFPALKPWSS